jgi:hypothetical protein
MAGAKPRPKAVEQQRRKKLNFELFEFRVRISRFGFPTPLLAQRQGWHHTADDTEVMTIEVPPFMLCSKASGVAPPFGAF